MCILCTDQFCMYPCPHYGLSASKTKVICATGSTGDTAQLQRFSCQHAGAAHAAWVSANAYETAHIQLARRCRVWLSALSLRQHSGPPARLAAGCTSAAAAGMPGNRNTYTHHDQPEGRAAGSWLGSSGRYPGNVGVCGWQLLRHPASRHCPIPDHTPLPAALGNPSDTLTDETCWD